MIFMSRLSPGERLQAIARPAVPVRLACVPHPLPSSQSYLVALPTRLVRAQAEMQRGGGLNVENWSPWHDRGRSGDGRRSIGKRLDVHAGLVLARRRLRSEEHTSELQSLMRISYAVFCL